MVRSVAALCGMEALQVLGLAFPHRTQRQRLLSLSRIRDIHGLNPYPFADIQDILPGTARDVSVPGTLRTPLLHAAGGSGEASAEAYPAGRGALLHSLHTLYLLRASLAAYVLPHRAGISVSDPHGLPALHVQRQDRKQSEEDSALVGARCAHHHHSLHHIRHSVGASFGIRSLGSTG